MQCNRRIDELGRLVIPIEYRKRLNIKSNDLMDIIIQNDKIIISKSSDNFDYEKLLYSLLLYSDYHDHLITNEDIEIFKQTLEKYLNRINKI